MQVYSRISKSQNKHIIKCEYAGGSILYALPDKKRLNDFIKLIFDSNLYNYERLPAI